ncbi:hypothetical protein QJS10_CPB11g00691 [Acorus calamus]|uniref:Uncharacterized protein n=1 Tax=Acorus calamus TaxID=4465 RepID=A0AAV9DRF5_ACOCL|nr:hypothetical protein QJS10_CPB11g00691 [Acorus calamus]
MEFTGVAKQGKALSSASLPKGKGKMIGTCKEVRKTNTPGNTKLMNDAMKATAPASRQGEKIVTQSNKFSIFQEQDSPEALTREDQGTVVIRLDPKKEQMIQNQVHRIEQDGSKQEHMVQVLDQLTEQAHLKDFLQTDLTPQEVHEEQSQIVIRKIPHSLDSIVAPSGGHLQEQLSVDLSPLNKLVNPNIKLTNESEEYANAHPQKDVPGKPPVITQSAHLSKKERKKLQQIQILEAHTSLLQATDSQPTFSDDLLLFIEASSLSALSLKHLFEEFYSASGLQLNTSKSQVFTNCSNMEFSQSLEIPQHHLPIRYLGMPLFTGGELEAALLSDRAGTSYHQIK